MDTSTSTSTMTSTSTTRLDSSSRKLQVFYKTVLKEKVKILPREIGSNVRDVVVAKLKRALEGTCTRHGYVRPGSVSIHEMSPGRLEGASLNGDVIYAVNAVAEVCNPVPGHVLPARVVNANKFGLLAHCSIDVPGKGPVPIIEAVVARHNYHGGAPEVPLDAVKIGDDVLVEVLGKTFELGDTKISVAGRLMRMQQSAAAPAVVGAVSPSAAGAAGERRSASEDGSHAADESDAEPVSGEGEEAAEEEGAREEGEDEGGGEKSEEDEEEEDDGDLVGAYGEEDEEDDEVAGGEEDGLTASGVDDDEDDFEVDDDVDVDDDFSSSERGGGKDD